MRGYEHGLGLESALRTDPPDLVVLDRTPALGPDAVVLTRRVRAMTDVPVLVICDGEDVECRLAAFAAGADHVLLKPFAVSELVARAKALIRRYRGDQDRPMVVGDITIDHAAHLVERRGSPLTLRPIEFRLLQALCRRPGAVVSKVQLLEAVWGDSFADVNLVEVHVSRLRRELERHGPRAIHTVRSVGYVVRPVHPVESPHRGHARRAPAARRASRAGVAQPGREAHARPEPR